MRVACERGVRVFAPIRGPFDDDRIRGLLKVTRGNKFPLLLGCHVGINSAPIRVSRGNKFPLLLGVSPLCGFASMLL
jgi:hypothetical protein